MPRSVAIATGLSSTSDAAVRSRESNASAYRNGFNVDPACRGAITPSTCAALDRAPPLPT
jgi:hypothetical protein